VNEPITLEGVKVWDLVQRLNGQMRVGGMGAITGLDMLAAFRMAEALGVSQIYMGFVLTAVRQDRKAKLAAMLGLGDRRICAVMALGMPQFRYPNYIDRAPAPVTRK
jgi:hypothetical protein